MFNLHSVNLANNPWSDFKSSWHGLLAIAMGK